MILFSGGVDLYFHFRSFFLFVSGANLNGSSEKSEKFMINGRFHQPVMLMVVKKRKIASSKIAIESNTAFMAKMSC